MNVLNALKGITGEFEINRLVGAFGASSYVIGAHVFIAHDVFYKGQVFDVTAYCLAFPGGLAVAIGAIAGAVAVKDRHVATARVQSAKADTADAANANEVK
jgi:hypothetical protein